MTTIDECAICGEVAELTYDEYLDAMVCCYCDTKREAGTT